MKTWFITGVSRGFGKALAEAALSRGDTVIGTVRSGTPVLAPGRGALHILPLEITDATAIESQRLAELDRWRALSASTDSEVATPTA
jgi:NAD(P)-dependent dehydrogenase (short-subunit alcohol dehydrogenase family)